MAKKRAEYFVDAERLLERSEKTLYFDESLWHQIHIDILRTNTNCPHFESKLVQDALKRILYVWAIRHPASGYVQGMNDIVLPLFDVFIADASLDSNENWGKLERISSCNFTSNRLEGNSSCDSVSNKLKSNSTGNYTSNELKSVSIDNSTSNRSNCNSIDSSYKLNEDLSFAINIKSDSLLNGSSQSDTPLKDDKKLMQAEADTYWCLCKLLANIQDNFTTGQVGIFKKIERLTQLLSLIDPNLVRHFEQEGIDILSFSFRWFNCLLVREFPLHCIVRMWDSYLGEEEEGGSFNSFHLFVCIAIIIRWSEQLREMNFQDCISWLQHLPTEQFGEDDLEILLSEAFVLKSVYSGV